MGRAKIKLMPLNPWAAWYNTWLLIKLTPKGVVLSYLFFSFSIGLSCVQNMKDPVGACVSAAKPAIGLIETEQPPVLPSRAKLLCNLSIPCLMTTGLRLLQSSLADGSHNWVGIQCM